MTSAARWSSVTLALAAVALLGAAPAEASVSITTDPGLRPGFQVATPDYVSRCEPGKPLRFTVSATGGDLVAVGDGAKRAGDFTVDETAATGESVSVRVTAGGHKSTHHVRCLPRDFPGWNVDRRARPQSQWFVLTPVGPYTDGYMTVFDARGVPVWWIHAPSYAPWDGKLLPNGNLIWARQFNEFFGTQSRGGWEEHSLDGRTRRVLKTIGTPTDMHDLTPTPGGNYLLDSYRRREHADLRPVGGPRDATVFDAEIQELTPQGKRVWRWNSKSRIALSERAWPWAGAFEEQAHLPPSERAYDIVHINSMEPDGDGIVVSARFLDAVFRIDRRSKRITWKLGGTKRPESLKVKGDPFGSRPLGGQHDARLYKDDTLTVYDNGASGGNAPRRPPRAVRYRIDTGKGTATLLEDVREPSVPRSGWGGSARKLPGGNWVAYWGGSNLMTETTPAQKRVMAIEFLADRYSYRAFPIPHGRLSAQQLRRGMDAIFTSHRGEVPVPAR